MPVKKEGFEALRPFLPEGSFDAVMEIIRAKKVHLTVTPSRKTKLGDYTHKSQSYQNHRISINGNLNPYSFLFTLLHELAHLIAFEQYGGRIEPHGREWKHCFSVLIVQFLQLGVFPADVAAELHRTAKNPAATTAGEIPLQRVLKRYDPINSQLHTVESLPPGSRFRIENGWTFIKGERIRKRYQCAQIGTNRVYLFQPLYEVEWLP